LDEKLVEEFIDKLIEHVNTKCSEAATYSSDSNDSCYGMDGWRTESELRKSALKVFGLKVEEDEEDEDED